MELVTLEQIDLNQFGKISDCKVYCTHIRIRNIKNRAEQITKKILDTSWIEKFDTIDQVTFEARALRTINSLVTNILNNVDDKVTSDFGEYLVSESARDTLASHHNHELIPLAELWKEKLSGNAGFDFHSITSTKLIAFGEAKYKSSGNPHTIALEQICSFITHKKDLMDLRELRLLASDELALKVINDKKAFVAAFSLNGINYKDIFDYALNSDYVDELLKYPELYLIGVEVCQ